MNKICCPAFCIYQILLSSFAEIENPDIIMKILITILTVPEVMMQMNRSPHITQYIKKKKLIKISLLITDTKMRNQI